MFDYGGRPAFFVSWALASDLDTEYRELGRWFRVGDQADAFALADTVADGGREALLKDLRPAEVWRDTGWEAVPNGHGRTWHRRWITVVRATE